MKSICQLSIFGMILIFMNPAQARVFTGTIGGGGGGPMISEFRSIAKTIITQRWCSAKDTELLRQTLETVRIRAVKSLKDPANKYLTRVKNQEGLAAYGSFNYIQLKTKTPKEMSFESLLQSKGKVGDLVAHELFRASGVVGTDGQSIDDNYKISVDRCGLDKFEWPQQNSGYYCIITYPVFTKIFEGNATLGFIEGTSFSGAHGYSEEDAKENTLSSCQDSASAESCMQARHRCEPSTFKTYQCTVTIPGVIYDEASFTGIGSSSTEAEHNARVKCAKEANNRHLCGSDYKLECKPQ